MEALSHTYSANAVNQYILENIAGVVPVVGEADPAAEVTAIQGEDSVNYPPQFGMKPERDGKYFFGFFRVDNTWEEAEHHYKVYAVKPDSENADRYLATRKEGSYIVPQALQPFTYDADGNTLTWRGWTYAWDAENRLKSVSKGDLLLEFTYDFSSRRVSKKVTRAEVVESHTTFIYDGYKLVEERDALNNNTLLRRYHWNLVLDSPATVYDASLNTTYYYLTDANKNVLALQDASGNRVATYDYSPFGEQLEATGDYADINPFRFSSEYFDNETGLVYYNYRYYNPATGRWLSREPLEERGSLNLYGMVNNNPVKYWDNLGLEIIVEQIINGNIGAYNSYYLADGRKTYLGTVRYYTQDHIGQEEAFRKALGGQVESNIPALPPVASPGGLKGKRLTAMAEASGDESYLSGNTKGNLFDGNPEAQAAWDDWLNEFNADTEALLAASEVIARMALEPADWICLIRDAQNQNLHPLDFLALLPLVPGGIGKADEVAEGIKNFAKKNKKTDDVSRAAAKTVAHSDSLRGARREVMKRKNILRSQQPEAFMSSGGMNQWIYRDMNGKPVVITEHLTDSLHPLPHVHAASPKLDDCGQYMRNKYGMIEYQNDGIAVTYSSK